LITNKPFALEPFMANAYQMFFSKLKNIFAHSTITPKRIA
jgi:hypothetical protein